jgi:hypothetical protein
MSTMYILEKLQEVGLYTKLEKCEFYQFNMKFWVVSFLEMTFTWIFTRFRPMLIELLQLIFNIFNVFLDLLTFIDISLPTIFQKWPFLFGWLRKINLFLESWSW